MTLCDPRDHRAELTPEQVRAAVGLLVRHLGARPVNRKDNTPMNPRTAFRLCPEPGCQHLVPDPAPDPRCPKHQPNQAGDAP